MHSRIQSPLAETAAGAVAADVLRACVHCGMCNATCPTYQLTGDELDGPRGRIYLIKQALEGEPAGRLTQHHLDRCLSCRACETTCPSGVQYHRLLDIGRDTVAKNARRPWGERLARTAIRLITPHPARLAPIVFVARALRFLPGVFGTRKIPAAVPLGDPSAPGAVRMILLAGCVQSVAAGHFNAAAQRVFGRIGASLDATPGAGCCGAVSAHLDAPDEARAFARRNIAAWTHALDEGAAAIVVTASGCAAFIRDYPDLFRDDAAMRAKAERVAAAVTDPIEILDQTGLSAARPPRAARIAVHDPCTLQHGPRLGGRVGAFLERLGYRPQPVADAHLCCGSAGAYSLLQPELAGRLRRDKLTALTAGAPEAIYTANIGCWMHLAETSPVPVRHWIEAVDDVI